MSYYDDNYGEWDGMDSSDPDFEDNIRFMQEVQRDSVWKRCKSCNRRVKLRRDYAICNSCAERQERGLEY